MGWFEFRRGGRRPIWVGTIAAAAVTLGLATACVPPPPPPPALQISTIPGLFPSFSPSVTDYVSRCDSSGPVTVSVTAPPGTTVSVDGQPPSSGTFAWNVTRAVGQSFTIVIQTATGSTTDYVRCLPADFPTWTVQTSGPTQAEWYEVAPVNAKYPAIFDSNGVPVWWGVTPGPTAFAQLLPDGNFGWVTANGEADEIGLNGAVVHAIQPAGSGTDWHDLLVLPNGDHVIAVDTARTGIDLSTAWGPSYSSNATVVDQVIKELAPDGTVVWSWDAMDHIAVSETDPQWRAAPTSATFDAYHWNSIEPTGTGFILSFRHMNAVYDINKSDGQVVWKLGGSTRPESLLVQNDPTYTSGRGFGGQHDARLLADGTAVTIHDNGTAHGRAPRGVHYQIDLTAHTATLLDQISDPLIPSSGCCGSARRLAGGNWVAGWGGSNTATELTPTGSRGFLLQLGSGNLLYRTIPVPFGQLDRAALRAGMDAQYSTSAAVHPATAPQPRAAPPNLP